MCPSIRVALTLLFILPTFTSRAQPSNPSSPVTPRQTITGPLSAGQPLPALNKDATSEPADTLPQVWRGGRLLAERQDSSSRSGLRVRIVSISDSRYPLRLEELLGPDRNGREKVIAR